MSGKFPEINHTFSFPLAQTLPMVIKSFLVVWMTSVNTDVCLSWFCDVMRP